MIQPVFAQSPTSNLEAQLRTLKDIHWPEAPGLLPQAPGFWLLGALVAGAVIAVAWRLYRNRLSPLRQARQELALLHRQLITESDAIQFAEGCRVLLKRVARQLYPIQRPDLLGQADWRQFLLDTGSGDEPPAVLLDALYQPNPRVAHQALMYWIDDWLKRQRYKWV